MRLDEKGMNEHGVFMCECGNKRPHAYEPGEWCGGRVMPKATDPNFTAPECLLGGGPGELATDEQSEDKAVRNTTREERR